MEQILARTAVNARTQQGVTLSIARSPQTRTAFQKLAYEEYAVRGWLDPRAYPDGILRDTYEALSETLIIQQDGEIISGMRIVFEGKHGFPHKAELKLDALTPSMFHDPTLIELIHETPKQHRAEITRVVGKRSTRKLTLDIIKSLYWYARMRHITLYVMVIDMGFFTLCNTHHIPITPIGIPVFCEGSWTIPAITQPLRWKQLIPKGNPAGWTYIEDTANLDNTWILP